MCQPVEIVSMAMSVILSTASIVCLVATSLIGSPLAMVVGAISLLVLSIFTGLSWAGTVGVLSSKQTSNLTVREYFEPHLSVVLLIFTCGQYCYNPRGYDLL